MSNSALDAHFDVQKVDTPKFTDFNFLEMVEQFLESESGARFTKSRLGDANSSFMKVVQ